MQQLYISCRISLLLRLQLRCDGGIVGPHRVLPAGLSSEPSEMPQAHPRPGDSRGCRTFTLGTGETPFTCSRFSAWPCLMSLVGGGSGAQFCYGNSQHPRNHTQTQRCDRSEGQAKSLLAISSVPGPKSLHPEFRVISRLVEASCYNPEQGVQSDLCFTLVKG